MVTISSANIKTNIILAPMSGHSDLSMRLICRETGAKFCFFEMTDSNSLIYGPRRKTSSILATVDEDAPIAAQLLGNDPSAMLRAAKEVLTLTKTSFIDINAACPVKKVVKKGAGAYLLEDTAGLCRIVKQLAVSLSVPITVKMRLGFEAVDIKTIVELAGKCRASGASALFVHGRTRPQGYAGDVDYKAIRAIKESVNIPVFGSGNVLTPQLAERMFKETGCDGILVARGALGNPWIFRDIENYLKNGTEAPEVSLETKKETLKRHLSYIEKYKDCVPTGRIGFMRKVMMWYLKGFLKASRARREVSAVKNLEEMVKLIDAI